MLLVYCVGLAGLLLSAPPRWSGLEAYAAALDEPWQAWLSVCHACAFLCPPILLVMYSCLHQVIARSRKVLTTVGLAFCAIFTSLVSITYFAQLTAVRTSLRGGQSAGLEPFVQLNPDSVSYALAILGWTLFLGLTSAFVAPALTGGGAPRVVRWALLVNVGACLVGVIGFLGRVVALDLVYLMTMGSSLIVASVGLVRHFRGLRSSMRQTTSPGAGWCARATAGGRGGR